MTGLQRKSSFRERLFLLLLLGALVVVLDQVSKSIVLSHLSRVYSLKVIDGFFSLTLVLNTGVAFGLFSQSPAAWKDLNRLASIAFSLIIGGAVGNMIDRFRFSKVVDFLDFYWKSYHWPAFNLADAAITLGVFLLLFEVLILGRKTPVL